MFSVKFNPPIEVLYVDNEMETLESSDDYQYLVMHSCALLAQTDCEFHIGGFGSDDWNFDVGYDSSSFLEELPRLRRGVRNGQSVEVDLYSEGVERLLLFGGGTSELNITCESRTAWIPEPSRECHDRKAVSEMLDRVAKDFALSLRLIVPQVAELPPFKDWI